MAADDAGDPVKKKATSILNALRAHGYVEHHNQRYRLTLPSLAAHFKDLRQELDPRNQATAAVRTALPERLDRADA